VEKLITTQEVAKIIGVSNKTVDRMRQRKTNKLKCIKINGTVRFDPEDVDAFLKKHKS